MPRYQPKNRKKRKNQHRMTPETSNSTVINNLAEKEDKDFKIETEYVQRP